MNHLLNFLKGLAMGAADVVPGVSGGTVALLVGIYQRLIRVITSFDRQFVRLLKEKQFREALHHIDWPFVVSLGLGLVTGFIITVKLLAHYLQLDATRSLILAAFFGMVVAAAVIVARLTVGLSHRDQKVNWLMGLVGLAISAAIFALQLGRDEPNTNPSLWYLYFCGAIAICAMILPGISGALILILLGVYETLVGKIKALLKFEDIGENLLVCICFGLGAISGLMLFSRVLRNLLDKHPGPTFSCLCGLMIGSLPLLWPFQVNTTPGVEDFKERIYQPVWPEALDREFLLHVAVTLGAIAFVLSVDWISRKFASASTTTTGVGSM